MPQCIGPGYFVVLIVMQIIMLLGYIAYMNQKEAAAKKFFWYGGLLKYRKFMIGSSFFSASCWMQLQIKSEDCHMCRAERELWSTIQFLKTEHSSQVKWNVEVLKKIEIIRCLGQKLNPRKRFWLREGVLILGNLIGLISPFVIFVFFSYTKTVA